MGIFCVFFFSTFTTVYYRSMISEQRKSRKILYHKVTGHLADTPFLSDIWCLSLCNPYMLQQQIYPYIVFYNLLYFYCPLGLLSKHRKQGKLSGWYMRSLQTHWRLLHIPSHFTTAMDGKQQPLYKLNCK